MVNKDKYLLITKRQNALVFKLKEYEREFGINEEAWRNGTEADRQGLVDYLTELFYQIYATRIIRHAYEPGDDELGEIIMTNDFRDTIIHRLKRYGEVKSIRQEARIYKLAGMLSGRLRPV